MLEELVDKEVTIRNVCIARMRETTAREFVDGIAQIRTIQINFHLLCIVHITAQKYHAPTSEISDSWVFLIKTAIRTAFVSLSTI